MASILPTEVTVTVASGTDVTVTAGATLTAANCSPGFQVSIAGQSTFVKTRTSTTEFTVWPAVTDGTGLECAISPVIQDNQRIATLNVRAAELMEQLSVVDANGRGLFMILSGDTGANDPGPTFIRFNASLSTPEDIDEVYLDVIDANQLDVSGIIDLWTLGTVLTVRSVTSNAYVSLRMVGPATNEGAGAWRKIVALEFVDADGLLVAGEAVAVEWNRVGGTVTIGDPTGVWSSIITYGDKALVTRGKYTFLSLQADNLNNEPVISPEPTSNEWWMYVPMPVAGDFGTFALTAQGTFLANDLIWQMVFDEPVGFPAGFTDSTGRANTPPTAEAVFTMKKNGITFGTVTFAAGSFLPTFSVASAVTFDVDDVLTIFAPAVADLTLSDVALTLRGRRDASISVQKYGTSVLDFTGTPTHSASVVVTGIDQIEADSLVRAWIDPRGGTAGNNLAAHQEAMIMLTVDTIVPGTGFTITGVCRDPDTSENYTNTYNIAWEWR